MDRETWPSLVSDSGTGISFNSGRRGADCDGEEDNDGEGDNDNDDSRDA